jgi:DNA invertase Pin-like site-specific DNA recombinase
MNETKNKPTEILYRCVVYERVSTSRQEAKEHPGMPLKERRKLDIDAQSDYANKFIALHSKFAFSDGVDGTHEYTDIRSGTSFYKREGYQAMKERLIRDPDHRDVNTILVATTNRIGRDFDEFMDEMQWLERFGIHVFEVKDFNEIHEVTQLDLKTDEQRAMHAMQLALHAYNNSHMVEDVTQSSINGVKRRIERKIYYFGGRPRFGYKWVGHEPRYYHDPDYIAGKRDCYVIDEDEAAIVRDIFDRYVNQDEGTTFIAKVYREKGITHRGTRFQPEFVASVLECPSYYDGRLVIQKTKNLLARKKIAHEIRLAEQKEREAMESRNEKIPEDFRLGDDKVKEIMESNGVEDGDVVIDGVYPPIVGKEIWETAQKQRQEGSRDFDGTPEAPKVNASNAVLSGLLFCACGSPMYSKGRAWYSHKDGTRVPGGYQSNCHKRGADCRNSTFLPYSVDYVIWQALMWHAKREDLVKASDKYWDEQAKGTLKSQRADIVRLKSKVDQAHDRMKAAIEVYAISKLPEDKKVKEKAIAAYKAAQRAYDEESRVFATDPVAMKTDEQKIIDEVRQYAGLKPEPEEAGSKQSRFQELTPVAHGDPIFMKKMINHFISKITYVHDAGHPKSPKVFVIEYKMPGKLPPSDKTQRFVLEKSMERIFREIANRATAKPTWRPFLMAIAMMP